MMDTSLAWLYELEDRYSRETGLARWSMSDWHNEPNDIILPNGLLSSICIDPEEMSRYRFVDSLDLFKDAICKFYGSNFDFTIRHENLAFCHNGTASIQLIAQILSQRNIRRALVVTPNYFSLLSSLDRCGILTFYFHIDLLKDAGFDAGSIINAAISQMVDAIFITNPVFSTGTIFSVESFYEIARFAEDRNIWLVIDETLSGLPWHGDESAPYASDIMRFASGTRCCLYIYSVTKALFINGVKHSIVMGDRSVIRQLERMADHVMGSLTVHQMDLAAKIYSQEFFGEVQSVARLNSQRFKEAYELSELTLENSVLRLTQAESGFHCFAYIPRLVRDASGCARKITSDLMIRHGVSTIPLAHFGFPPFSPVGFRVNLSKNPGRLHFALLSLAEVAKENSDLFDE